MSRSITLPGGDVVALVDERPAVEVEDVTKRLLEMRWYAEQPENWVHVEKGETPEAKHGDRTHYSLRLPEMGSRVAIRYTVDVRTETRDGMDPAVPRAIRHLSVQQSMPGVVTQMEANVARDDYLASWLWLVEVFWRTQPAVVAVLKASTPIPVADPSTRQLHYRTPLVAHFFLDVVPAPQADSP